MTQSKEGGIPQKISYTSANYHRYSRCSATPLSNATILL